MKKVISLLMFCLLIACGTETKKVPHVPTDTECFATLLKTAFGKSIDTEQHFYLLVTEGCHGCVKSSANFFHSLAIKDSLLPITIITSRRHLLPEELQHHKIVWLDTTGKVDRCRLLHHGSDALIEVHNGAVDSVRNFEITDVETIWRYVNFKKKKAGP